MPLTVSADMNDKLVSPERGVFTEQVGAAIRRLTGKTHHPLQKGNR